jgi:hypothetical protein
VITPIAHQDSNWRFIVNKKAYFFSLIMVGIFVLSGCMPGNYKSTMTSLELQSIQSREFETTKKIAFASTLSVMQDLGYIIESGDFDTGLITGKSPTDRGMIFGGTTQEFRKATGFVETISNKTAKIRLNFVDITKASSAYGMAQRVDKPIEDPELYRGVFEKIQKAIFVRSNID